MIGQVLGSYRVVSRIGGGGMGTIYLAEHQMLGSHAAIKVLLPEMSQQRRIVERFFDEARAATRIHDPGIVTVLDFGWHEGSAYLVMEHLIGDTLAERLRRVDRMPVVDAVRITQQCAIAMAAAHMRGIVHRDLKPDNIFLVPDPAAIGGERIKILDFGIAKLIDDADASHSRTQTGVIMGTPAFMSPEQCRGAGGVDHRTDIYALGCVLFNMVCGRPPFIAGTPGDLLAAHLREQPPVPSALVPGLPPAVDEMVLRCLAKDAEQRFSSMTELVRAGATVTGDNLAIETIPPLRASMPDEAATVATTGPANTTLRSSAGQASGVQSQPWRGGIIVAGIVVAIAAVVTFVLLREPARSPSSPAPAAAAGVQAPLDADVARADAQLDAAPLDAAPPRSPPRTPPRPPRAPPQPPGAPAHAGSGAMPSGSASSTRPYDPYENR